MSGRSTKVATTRRPLPAKAVVKRKSGRLVRLVRQVLRWPLRLAFYAAVAAGIWVASYRAIDPPGGYYMAREWLRLGKIEREWADLSAMSPHLPRAALAAEDAGFCGHYGFDIGAIQAAMAANAEGKRLRGGSTISQQVAKNLFVWPERSWLRKGLEAGFTVLIEAMWPKRRIVEVYLNIVEFDEGVFGAEAAARHYFGRDAASLTLAQSARLAAILPDPKDRSAARPGPFTAKRARAIADGAETLRQTGAADCVAPG